MHMLFLFVLSIFDTFSSHSDDSLLKLDRLTAVDLTRELENSPRSIVFATDNYSSIEFARLAINKYKDQVKFILTSPEEVPKKFFTSDPPIIVFDHSRPIDVEAPPLDSKSFVYWVEYTLNPTLYNILLPPQLKMILESSKPKLFQIDINDNVSDAQNNEESEVNDEHQKLRSIIQNEGLTVLNSTSSLFKQFGITLNNGYYVFRPQDRQLIPFNGSFGLQTKSLLMHPSEIPHDSEKLIVGFVMEEFGDAAKIQCEIITKLANKYGNDDFIYTLATMQNIGLIMKEDIAFCNLPKPFFAVAKPSAIPTKRWILRENITSVDDYEIVEKFFDEVKTGDKPSTIISEPVPPLEPKTLQKIVGDSFKEYVYDDSIETIVVFINGDTFAWKIFKPVINAISVLFDNNHTKFYYFDVSKNDLPSHAPKLTTYPAVVMWPAGKKDEPCVFQGEKAFLPIVDFIKAGASHKLNKPKQDIKNILNSITAKINELIGKEEDPRTSEI